MDSGEDLVSGRNPVTDELEGSMPITGRASPGRRSGGAADRILLSVPFLSGAEERFVAEALASNWVAPLGPQVDAFEAEIARVAGARHAIALTSGTAALHLALVHLGIGPGDEVLVSTLTFAGTVHPVKYVGATPVFVDSEERSWNMDPDLVAEAVRERVRRGRPPAAIVLVHLYGQAANLGAVTAVADAHGIPVIEDAAEALGTLYRDRHVGGVGRAGVFSFNGNKIITTSGGGMLVTDDQPLARHARKLASQAREDTAHYEHREVGFNYRMSNVLAAIGRGQLLTLDQRVAARRAHFDYYRTALGDLPGVAFMPEAGWGRHTRWLTTLTIDPVVAGVDRETVRAHLERCGIEARPVWKPMHTQPVFAGCPILGGGVAERIFANGLCLPSSTQLGPAELTRVSLAFREALGASPPSD